MQALLVKCDDSGFTIEIDALTKEHGKRKAHLGFVMLIETKVRDLLYSIDALLKDRNFSVRAEAVNLLTDNFARFKIHIKRVSSTAEDQLDLGDLMSSFVHNCKFATEVYESDCQHTLLLDVH